VYVKIAATYEAASCPSCDQIRVLQIIRRTTRTAAGETVAADPRHRTRQALAGWDDPDSGSRGWYVDTPINPRNATTRQPYADRFRLGRLELAHAGSAREPALLWDAPGDWADLTNTGAEFETCAICSRPSGSNTTLACVHWGFHTDNAGDVSFEPGTPTTNCGITMELVDAVERFERQPRNRPSDLDFVGMCLSPASWTGPAECEFTPSQESRLIATKSDARWLTSQALLGVSSGDRYMVTLARRIFQVGSPGMTAIADRIQLVLGALQNMTVTCGTCADTTCNQPGIASYVTSDRSSLVICPRYFLLDGTNKRRTLIFEAANIAGIDPSGANAGRFCRDTAAVECQDPCGNLAGNLTRNPDALARYIECAGFSR
jgi:hypothetical protein